MVLKMLYQQHIKPVLDFKEISAICKGEIINFAYDYPLRHLLLDTRKIISPASSVFFSIKGPRHDGHAFLKEAYEKGVRQFIVEKELPYKELYPDANILLVKSSVEALHKIAETHRRQFTIPILAIAGSNAKTTIKEWLTQLLIKDYFIVRNPKSFNSQVGVPLSVWEINSSHTLGIFEAGISQPGEMEKLEKIIRPTWGLFSNIGPAHDEGFQDRYHKTSEKLRLFKSAELLFYCKDHLEIDNVIKQGHYSFKTFTWSFNDTSSDIFIKKIRKDLDSVKIQMIVDGRKASFTTAFRDDASLENIIHCIVVLVYLKVDFDEIQKRILLLQPIAMRLELKEGINGCHIIDDTYNNDLAGLTMALNFLAQQHQNKRRTVILSDVLQTGMEEGALHNLISEILKEKKVLKFIGIGPVLKKHAALLPFGKFYTSTDDFLQNTDLQEFKNENILIKGARIFRFEKIVNALQQKVHGTILHINLDALSHNLNFYRSCLRPTTKIMVMVKAFAYGSGSFEVANLLQFHRVDYLGVAYIDEGVALRENGITLPIMVMNPSPEGFSKLIEFSLEPEIYSLKILKSFFDYVTNSGISSKIHLKIDTGMKRLGFEVSDIHELLNILKSTDLLQVVSIFTHLAGADEAIHTDFSRHQLEIFMKTADDLETSMGYSVTKHGLNSAGIIRFPEFQMDMVRLGIGLYGIEANNIKQKQLREVGKLKTVISQIKHVKTGDSVGYSRKGRVNHDAEIATIAIGYADGYGRVFGNGVGKIQVNGITCPTIGNICMDMTMVDVTGTGAKEGDEVVVFGDNISVSEMAEAAGTISYEILTGISERVKRVFYTE
jgi:alanine racemase